MPRWYLDIIVADRLHMTVLDVQTLPLLWYNRALAARNAEAEAEEYHVTAASR